MNIYKKTGQILTSN